MRTIRNLAITIFTLSIVGCVASEASENIGTDSSELKVCPDGDCGPTKPPPPKPTPHPPPPPPSPIALTISADQIASTLGIALGGTVVQVSQAGRSPLDIHGGHVSCHYDTTAEHQCQLGCADDPQPSNCFKACQGLQTLVCGAPVCGTYSESSYISFSGSLKSLAGQKACDPNDCQTCTNGKEPAVFDRALLGIPYPIVDKQIGLVTYHCSVTKLRFDIPVDVPVTMDLGGIHLKMGGAADSPAIVCDNGAPDLDVGSPNVTIDLSPYVSNGAITATAHAHFDGNVSAHNGIGGIINLLDDAQGLVTSNATKAIDAQVTKLGPALGAGLDTYVRTRLPSGARIDHSAYGTSGLTVYYFPK